MCKLEHDLYYKNKVKLKLFEHCSSKKKQTVKIKNNSRTILQSLTDHLGT